MKDEDIYFEAEYKLQNSLRITLEVEGFVTEVNAADGIWMPVTEYVEGLIAYIRRGGKT